MKQKQDTIKCFIPAVALEHPDNGEFFKLKDKISAAVNRRLIAYGKRRSEIYIFIKDIKFDRYRLGYHVEAKCS